MKQDLAPFKLAALGDYSGDDDDAVVVDVAVQGDGGGGGGGGSGGGGDDDGGSSSSADTNWAPLLKYEVVKRGAGFELRRYDPTKWACAALEGGIDLSVDYLKDWREKYGDPMEAMAARRKFDPTHKVGMLCLYGELCIVLVHHSRQNSLPPPPTLRVGSPSCVACTSTRPE